MTASLLPEELQSFIASWEDNDTRNKAAFEALLADLAAIADVSIDFKARPGISYSIRGVHAAQTDRSLFVMLDVVDDDPAERWLSVCFYEDMVNDPEEKGDLVPEGLLGEDGYCFDLDGYVDADVAYLAARIREAAAAASGA